MSLIADALKTAQREKLRNAAGDRALAVPVLVPLRTRQPSAFSWRRAAGLGVAGMAVLAAAVVVLQRSRAADNPAPHETPALVSSSPAATPAPRAATNPTRSARTTASATHRDTIRTHAAAPAPLNVSPSAPALIAAPAPRSNATQVAAGSDASPVQQAATPPSREPASASAGRLRIAVDQPRDAEVTRLFAVGVAAHRGGDLAGARNAYESVLSLAPGDVDALNNLALVLMAQGEAARAEVLLRRALSLAPRNGGAWNNLGAVLRARGRPTEAIAAFQHALAIDPLNQAARVSLAQQYLAIGSLDQARSLLMESIVANPDGAEAQYTLGQVLELQGDVAGATRAYREFIRVAPPRLAASVDRVKLHLDTLEPHP